MSTNYYKKGDHWVICDICGVRRFRSQCSKTWDGYLACHPNRCWYPKHPLDGPQPVINDPQPIVDARPDVLITNIPMVDSTYVSTWDSVVNTQSEAGHVAWNAAHRKYGSVDEPDDYI